MNLPEAKDIIETYRQAGKSREEIVIIISGLSPNGETSDIFEYIDMVYQTDIDIQQDDYNLTDAGNAEYFVSLFGNKLRYDHFRNRWLEWSNHHWKEDSDSQVRRFAIKSTRKRYHDAPEIIPNLEHRDKVAKWAIGSEQRARLEACLWVASALKPIADDGKQWDSNPWLLCVQNGVIDLRTGELRDGIPEDMITMQSPVIYDPGADCRLWLKFLEQITCGDIEYQNYLQRAIGYSLTADMRNQLWFFIYGLGSNGKSTFTMTIRKLMGDYGVRIDSDDLMIKDKKARGSNPKEGIADTFRKRFALASEVQDGRRLDIGLLKDMTGQDTIKARRLYEHEVEFSPTHKLWMFGNHKPVITDTTVAAWRRLKLLPFTFTVPDNEIDMELQEKLDAELPGILNWAIQGCLDWYKNGLIEPAVVTDAVTAYRHDSDILADFIDDRCVLESLSTVKKGDLKEVYETWCKDNSMEPVTQRTFKARLTEKGVGERRSSDGKARLWYGIRQKFDDEETAISDKSSNEFTLNLTRDNENPKSPLRENENARLWGKTQSLVSVVRNVSEDKLPDCPKCGLNEWTYDEESNLVCPCGYKE